MSQKPAWLKAHGKPWRRGEAKTVYENPWIKVTEQAAIAPTGAPATYGLVGFKNLALAILPIHADGSVVLVGQHRFPFGDYSWEIPEGGGPKGENPLDDAKRELAEEAGLAAEHWRAALDLDLSNSITDERVMTWVAWGLSAVPVDPDPTEVIVVARVPFRDLLAEIERGAVRDSLTVATAYKAYHMAREGELPAALAQAMLGA